MNQPNIIFRFVEEEDVAKERLIKLRTDYDDNDRLPTIYLIPGVEGMCSSMRVLGERLNGNVYCLQYGYGEVEESINDIVEPVLQVS